MMPISLLHQTKSIKMLKPSEQETLINRFRCLPIGAEVRDMVDVMIEEGNDLSSVYLAWQASKLI